jgi:hypothetical protein
MTIKEQETFAASDDQVIWGAAAIAKVIGRSEKGAFHALESGKVPGARKVAGRWGLHLRTFHSFFTDANGGDARPQSVAA